MPQLLSVFTDTPIIALCIFTFLFTFALKSIFKLKYSFSVFPYHLFIILFCIMQESVLRIGYFYWDTKHLFTQFIFITVAASGTMHIFLLDYGRRATEKLRNVVSAGQFLYILIILAFTLGLAHDAFLDGSKVMFKQTTPAATPFDAFTPKFFIFAAGTIFCFGATGIMASTELFKKKKHFALALIFVSIPFFNLLSMTLGQTREGSLITGLVKTVVILFLINVDIFNRALAASEIYVRKKVEGEHVLEMELSKEKTRVISLLAQNMKRELNRPIIVLGNALKNHFTDKSFEDFDKDKFELSADLFEKARTDLIGISAKLNGLTAMQDETPSKVVDLSVALRNSVIPIQPHLERYSIPLSWELKASNLFIDVNKKMLYYLLFWVRKNLYQLCSL